jgi:predicted deacylase
VLKLDDTHWNSKRREGSNMTTARRATDFLNVGALRAEPGAKARGSVEAALGVTTVDMPVTLINGARPGPKVVITAGVHGDEFTGIGAATELAALLGPEELHGRLVVCPVANPPAVYGRSRLSPVDGANLNRIFPGDPDGGPSERLAAWLFDNLLDGADAYIDLHAGGVGQRLCDFVGYRISGDDELDARARDMAHAIGFEDVVIGLDADGGNSHAAATRRGIASVLVELGELGERDPAEIQRLLNALLRVLRSLGLLGTPDEPLSPVREWVWAGCVPAAATGLWYPTFRVGERVLAGETIGRIVDPAGGPDAPVTATASGRVFYGTNGLTVVPGDELAAIAAPRT